MTPIKVAILKLLSRYRYLRTADIKQALLRMGHVRSDDDGSFTRSVIRKLENDGLLRRHLPKMVQPGTNQAAPVFAPTVQGSSVLAQELGDTKWLLTHEPNFRDWMSLNHYCALSSLQMTIDQAFAGQKLVKLKKLVFEHEVVNPDAQDPSKRYKLYTRIDDKVVCVPDSMMEIEIGTERRLLYTEYETGSDTPGRVSSKKHKGFAGLAEKKLWKRHGPEASGFSVLCFCPYRSWRDHLRHDMKDKPGQQYWLFCDVSELKPETFLHAPIWYTAEAGPIPLIPASHPVAIPVAVK